MIRLEHIKIKERRSQAKILGTLLTFSGALLMTVYKGPIIDLIWSHRASQHASHSSADTHWIAGTLLILVGCCAWSAFYILQVSLCLKASCKNKSDFYICEILRFNFRQNKLVKHAGILYSQKLMLRLLSLWFSVNNNKIISCWALSCHLDMLDGCHSKCSSRDCSKATFQRLGHWLGL